MSNDALTNFMGLSSFLIGVPLPGLQSLDSDLGQSYLNLLNAYLATPQYTDPKTGMVYAPGPASFDAQYGGFPIPPDSNSGLTPNTMTTLLNTWGEISATGGDPTAAVNKQIFGNAQLSALAQKSILIWYTGLIDNIPGPAELYDRALVWSISYAHPMAVPRSFGYWQFDPTATGVVDEK